MAIFDFKDPISGKSFEVTAPPGFTEEQARAVFEKQLSTGALVGLKPGDLLDAAKQAAGGLTAAATQVMQGAAKIAGGVEKALTGAFDAVKNSAAVLSNGLKGAYGAAKSATTKAYEGISNAVTTGNFNSLTSGINVGNFAKQATALVPMAGMKLPDVTATLAQAQKLTGQAASTVTNAGGLGQFGLNANQLELAGYLKPGTAAKYIDSGASNLTSVLKSPAVWTGKDAVNNLTGMLSNPNLQSKVQQQLMSQGLNSMQQFGVPIGSLTPQQLAGTALNAAKGVGNAVKWAQNQTLDSATKATMDSIAKGGAFAVNFAQSKLNDAMKGLVPNIPGFDTVNRATLDAAATRIVGNAKVPTFDYTNKPEGITLAKVEQAYQVIDAESLQAAQEAQRYANLPVTSAAQGVENIRVFKRIQAVLTENSSKALGVIREAESLPNNQGKSIVAKLESTREFDKKVIEILERARKETESKIAQQAV